MRVNVGLVGTLLLLVVGCGGAEPAPPAAPARPVAASTPSTAAAPTSGGPRALARSAVKAAVAQGLGTFLQQVDLDDQPVMVGGKFHGFRVAALHESPFWNGVDLAAGDVVLSINGLPIERPDQAQVAFDSLATANELRVDYERQGQPRRLVYPITDGK